MKPNLLISGLLIVAAIGVVVTRPYWHRLTASSNADKTCIQIHSAPFNIDRSGRYCLEKDVESAADGITIKADFVTLDLGGHVLRGPLDKQAVSIGVSGQHISNVRITNGTVEGFGTGIILASDVRSHTKGFNQIDRVLVTQSRQAGIRMAGYFNRLLDCEIRFIGGGIPSRLVHTHGVLVTGPGAIVARNKISEIRGDDIAQKAEGIGLALTGGVNGTIVSDNTIENNSVFPSDPGQWVGRSPSTYGIWAGGDGMSNVTIVHNEIRNFVNGIIIDTHVSAVISGNQLFNTPVPMSARGPRSEIDRAAAGVNGYTPSEGDRKRPFGVVVFGVNECHNTNDVTLKLSATKKTVANCVMDRDVSFDQISAFIAAQ
jgi:hypothetical protein